MSNNRYAIIEDGLVINVIIADEEFVLQNYPGAKLVDDAICPGYGFDGTNFYIPVIEIEEVNNELEAE